MDTQDLNTRWNALNPTERRRQWARFTEALDCGDAGYHPFYGILAPLWAGGGQP